MIVSLIKRLIPPRKAKAEIQSLRHEINNHIQAVQSGNRVLQSMSGTIDLVQRGKQR